MKVCREELRRLVFYVVDRPQVPDAGPLFEGDASDASAGHSFEAQPTGEEDPADGRWSRSALTPMIGLSTEGNTGNMNVSSRDHQHTRTTSVHCAECGSSSGLYWRGWRACRTDEPETDEPPALAFYCPTCAEREFGARRGRFWTGR
jgi:DNA-directed RNA polymerase subunit M/transcription elongation factor TFIIS